MYWANPPVDMLNKDWYFILYDQTKGHIWLFLVPKNTFTIGMVNVKNDKPGYIDVQIDYGDPTFTNKRSGLSYYGFMKESLDTTL